LKTVACKKKTGFKDQNQASKHPTTINRGQYIWKRYNFAAIFCKKS